MLAWLVAPKEKSCVVYASVDATGTQTICGWFLPFLATFLSWRMKAATLSHLVATEFLFLEYVLDTAGFPLTMQKKMTF